MDYYAERQQERPKLSEQKEFRSVLNAVIQEAENIRLGVVTFEDREMNDEMEDEELTATPQTLWQQVMVYQEAKAVLYDEDASWAEKEEAVHSLERLWDEGLTAAAHQLGKCYRDGLGVIPDEEQAEGWFLRSAEAGNQYAQYALGKLYLMGRDVKQDRDTALYWFTQAAEQGNEYAQFFLDRWDTMGPPSVMLSATRLLHRMAQTFREAPMPYDGTTMHLRPDHKLHSAQQEKRIAMGHKEDDHEEQTQGWGGMTMGM